MDQPYLIYTQGANNFELREEKHSLGAMDEVTHSQARVAQDEPKALQVLMYDNLQNYTLFNDNTMERMLLQEAVRRVHLPYMALGDPRGSLRQPHVSGQGRRGAHG